MDLFKKYIPLLENVIKDSKISKNKINELVLVGGLPAFQNAINGSRIIQWKRNKQKY